MEYKMEKEKQLTALANVYAFFSNFNGVPGSLASEWGKALEVIAAVAKAVQSEVQESQKEEK
jgi:hypothetical protein